MNGPASPAFITSHHLIESHPKIKIYVSTYAMTSTSEISAVKALSGEIQNYTKLPVTLPGIVQRDFCLPWPKERPQAIASSSHP